MQYKPGIENIAHIHTFLKDKKIALLTNPSGVDNQLCSTIDILTSKYHVVKLLAPEHGIRGDQQAGVRISSYTDEKTGLPVVSLFGEHRGSVLFAKPKASILDGVDCVVYDIQDLGLRHFSYPYLMAEVMMLCAQKHISFVVLDRYNPLGLRKICGNIFDNEYKSGVGNFSLATQYAMTIGELAQYINAEFQIQCDLAVVPCSGLSREKDYRDYQPLWILPGPNCPTFETAIAYVGTVLFEGTNVSEGRGTTKPFEFIGAPWLKNEEVVESMRKKNISGVLFRPAYFTPTFSKYHGALCKGLQLHITDIDTFDPYTCALHLIDTIRRMHPEFEFISYDGIHYFIDLLSGTDILRKEDFSPDTFIKEQTPLLEHFRKISEKYYIYE